MSRPPDLSMVLPTYNERERLAELTEALFEAAAAARIDLELIVVDDNSPDGTGALADGLAAANPRLRVVHRAGKLGLGTAVVDGFRAASSSILGVMDADFSHPPGLVPRMLEVLQSTSADVVVASRYITGGSTPNWPWKRRLISRIGCVLARPLTPIRDATSGFFLIRRSTVNEVTIQAGGFKICLELIVRTAPRRLVEIPYRFDDRELGESKMSLREAAGYLVQLYDLYRVRLGTRGRDVPEYRQMSLGDRPRST